MFYFNPPNCTSSPCESRRQDRGRAGAGRILVQSAEEERNKSRAGRRAKTHPWTAPSKPLLWRKPGQKIINSYLDSSQHLPRHFRVLLLRHRNYGSAAMSSQGQTDCGGDGEWERWLSRPPLTVQRVVAAQLPARTAAASSPARQPDKTALQQGGEKRRKSRQRMEKNSSLLRSQPRIKHPGDLSENVPTTTSSACCHSFSVCF